MGGMSIRHAHLDDAETIATLGARLFQAAFGANNDPDDMRKYLESSFALDKVRAELDMPGSVFLLVEEDEGVFGYARVAPNPSPDCVDGERPVELVRIYIDASKAGQGHGAALMSRCVSIAKGGGYDALWLGVWGANANAVAFYQRWGFSVVGERPFLLGGDDQSDFIMARAVHP